MKFLICPLTTEEADSFGSTTDFFKNGDTLYDFCIMYQEDEGVVIRDSEMRLMPIDITQLPDLIATLSRIYNYQFRKDTTLAVLKEELINGFVW